MHMSAGAVVASGGGNGGMDAGGLRRRGGPLMGTFWGVHGARVRWALWASAFSKRHMFSGGHHACQCMLCPGLPLACTWGLACIAVYIFVQLHCFFLSVCELFGRVVCS